MPLQQRQRLPDCDVTRAFGIESWCAGQSFFCQNLTLQICDRDALFERVHGDADNIPGIFLQAKVDVRSSRASGFLCLEFLNQSGVYELSRDPGN